MRRPLQDIGDGRYERPGDPWVCGLAADGAACPFGPTLAGRCPALDECIPVADGRGWRCNRSDLRGGPCADGPSSEGKCCHAHRCTPVRSLRSHRKRFVLGAAFFTAGLLLAALSSDWRDQAIVPGQLTRHHAQIVGRTDRHNRCDACHPAAGESPLEWVLAATWGRTDGVDQTALCMDCHKNLAPTDLARLAHNVPADHLAVLTREQGGTRAAVAHADSAGRELACAVCHQEHHGADHDLAAVTDAQCQNCHQQQYASFASDHPDFGAWPYQRPHQIAFDHVAHAAKHFPAQSATFTCQTCHVDDSTGDVKLLVHFDQACAKCHNKNIDASLAEGIAVLAVPTLDLDALHEAGHETGPWPESASGDFDGKLPATMQVLLAADPDAGVAMTRLGEGFTLADVDPDDPQQVAAAAEIGRATKELLDEIANDGHTALEERLPGSSPNERSALVGRLPMDTIVAAREEWFTGSQTAGELPATELAKLASGGGWFRDDRSMTIRYQPIGHADPWLQAWLDLAVRTNNSQLRTALLEDLGRPNSPGTCLSCHQVQDDGRSIAWRGFDRRHEPRTFTKFSHRPHTLQPELANCTHCHALNVPESNSPSLVSVSSAADPHDFLPIGKQACASCHTPQAAGNACIQCHNYHVQFKNNR